MFRTALIWIFVGSLLLCPLRCGKSVGAGALFGASLDQHCCGQCHSNSTSQSEPENHLPGPDSGCGCLHCICKGALVGSELKFSSSKALWQCWNPNATFATFPPPVRQLNDISLHWFDPLRGGAGLRVAFQIWLI